MKKFKVFINEHIDKDALNLLQEQAVITNNLDELEEVDAIILRALHVDSDMIKEAKNLKVIGKHGIGYDSIDINVAKEKGIKVVYTPHANVQSVAELIIAYMTNIARNVSLTFEKVKSNQIQSIAPKEFIGYEINNKTLGLVGCGKIGQKVAEIAKNGFNMNLIAYDPFVSIEDCKKYGIEKVNELEDLMYRADIVSVSVPLTRDTYHLIGEAAINQMKSSAILINTSRGGVVDEEALYQALKTNKIFAAASDVFEQEPPTTENLLLSLDNFVATPHIGANTVEAMKLMGTTVVDEVLRILNGKEANHRVV